jgi:hypothetical protein
MNTKIRTVKRAFLAFNFFSSELFTIATLKGSIPICVIFPKTQKTRNIGTLSIIIVVLIKIDAFIAFLSIYGHFIWNYLQVKSIAIGERNWNYY